MQHSIYVNFKKSFSQCCPIWSTCVFNASSRVLMRLQSPVACFLVITTTGALDDCKETPCQNAGECVLSFRCACLSGWGGEYCNGKLGVKHGSLNDSKSSNGYLYPNCYQRLVNKKYFLSINIPYLCSIKNSYFITL